MNPPQPASSLEPLSDRMFSELLTEIRAVRSDLGAQIDRVHDSLDAHVRDEMGQYAQVQLQLREMRDDVIALKTKMGFLAAGVSAVVATFTAWVSKVFF